jgi:D-alanine-D-alanine ligase
VKIALLLASYEGSSTPFAALDPESDPSVYLPEHAWTTLRLLKATAEAQLQAAPRFDAYVNLCDGAADEDRAGIEVVQTLEALKLPFTGAGAAFYDPTRAQMKAAARASGVRVPESAFVQSTDECEHACTHMRFPMIVKHPSSYSSVGLTPASRVTRTDQLREQVACICAEYGAALVEEFIEGREFTVLVTEPRTGSTELDGATKAARSPWALVPVEFTFPKGETFKHFDLKWRAYDDMGTHVVNEPNLDAALRRDAAAVFEALGGSGYGRCDFRVNADGEVFFLEINPNCGIFYPSGQFGSADFILQHEPGGHRAFLLHLLERAKARSQPATP